MSAEEQSTYDKGIKEAAEAAHKTELFQHRNFGKDLNLF